MHTVELLDKALGVAKQAGYKIRQEWLGESRGGACTIKGQKWLFLDPTRSPRDQLEEVLDALREDEAARQVANGGEMASLLEKRNAA